VSSCTETVEKVDGDTGTCTVSSGLNDGVFVGSSLVAVPSVVEDAGDEVSKSLLKQLVEHVAGSFETCSRTCSNWVVVLPVGVGAVWETPSKATDTSRTPVLLVLKPWQFVEQIVGIFMVWLMAMASWVMSTAAGAMLSTEVDVETNGTTVGTDVVVAARMEVATQLALLAAEEAIAADSSESSSAEIGAGAVMTRGGVTASADAVLERMVEKVPRGTGGNAADFVVDEADAAAAGARVDVSASTRVASQLVVEAV
jgi:hypothetical protein